MRMDKEKPKCTKLKELIENHVLDCEDCYEYLQDYVSNFQKGSDLED